jgi:nitrogen fixation protein FixH
MSPSAIASAPPKGLRGGHVLAMVCGFFGVVMSVDGAFAYLALKTHPGEVSVTPYEDGLLYNRHLAQMQAQARLGWRAAAEAAPGRLLLQVCDAEGRPVSGLRLAGKLERPATEAGRLVPTFVEVAPGRYEARVDPAGTWDFSVEARDAPGHLFTAERRLTWR